MLCYAMLCYAMLCYARGHPFSTYAVRGRGGGGGVKFCLFPYVRPYKNCVQGGGVGGGGGVKNG